MAGLGLNEMRVDVDEAIPEGAWINHPTPDGIPDIDDPQVRIAEELLADPPVGLREMMGEASEGELVRTDHITQQSIDSDASVLDEAGETSRGRVAAGE